jgi:hypothetical protein
MNLTKARPLVLTAVLLGLTTAALADSTFERTLNVADHPDLYVSTTSGDIHIIQGSGDQIRIVGHVHAGWAAFGAVASRVQHIVDNPPITQNGNSVRIGGSAGSLFNSLSIDYNISVPGETAMNLHSDTGDIVVDHVGRFLAASSASGDVHAHLLHGSADLESASGDLELADDGPGDVKARTGSGDIQLHNFNGGLNARTGTGDITADGHLQGSSMVTAGSGDVKLHLTNDSHFTLEASTGSGDIHLHMPGVSATNSDTSRHHITMAVNGGGPPLEIRTGSGDIDISPR